MILREDIQAFGQSLRAGEGGDMLIPPNTAPVNPASGRPWRLHYVADDKLSPCIKCGVQLLQPRIVAEHEPLDPESKNPIATRSLPLWRACIFNCEMVPAPAGKPTSPLTGNGV